MTRRLLERAALGMRDAADPTRLATLTERETEVLRLVGQGLTNDEIAQRLFLSPLTAKTHVSRIMQKLAPGTACNSSSPHTNPASSRPAGSSLHPPRTPAEASAMPSRTDSRMLRPRLA
ncbi:helix-turn-helix transcriptional regulator [Microbacterium terregens]|uniref:response regulator transcription factor n=1 Tax=Microbacterium terregens TaxID=69363 RepID=UPI0031D753FC